MSSRALPAGFLIGCATAAHQVEGGIDNDWSEFERQVPSPIAGGGRSTRAIDHYVRYRDDLTQLAAAGQNAHRLSIEWARVEPSPGVFDPAALAHYRDVVRHCGELDLEPVLTLHHFTLPRWLAIAAAFWRQMRPRCSRATRLCAPAPSATVSAGG